MTAVAMARCSMRNISGPGCPGNCTDIRYTYIKPTHEQTFYLCMTNIKSSKSSGGIRVISRAADILAVLKTRDGGFSLGEIARATDLPRATVQRIIGAMESERLVISGPGPGTIRLGPAFLGVTATALLDIQSIVRPYLLGLSEQLSETVDLSVLVGTTIVFIDQVAARQQRLHAISSVGAEFPAHSCAPGKVLLASCPDEDISALYAGGMDMMTAHTVENFEELGEEIDLVRKTGYAADKEEHSRGICAVSALIQVDTRRAAAVSIPVPAQRFYDDETKYISAVLQCCREINEAYSAGTPPV